MKADRFIAPGTRVRLDLADEEGNLTPECGVVVHCWHDKEIDAYDCYVAFFGHDFPSARPIEKPYILRYAALSLTVVAENSNPPTQ